MSSLWPDDRSSRHHDKSKTRSRDARSRSRSDVGTRSPPNLADFDGARGFKDYAPVGMASIQMPEMPPMPSSFGDDIGSITQTGPSRLRSSGPGLEHAATFPLAGGGIPYPTSSFFPDPDHFDITGGGKKTSIDSPHGYCGVPYPEHDMLTTTFDNKSPRRHESMTDFTPSATASIPPASAFYGGMSASNVDSPTPDLSSTAPGLSQHGHKTSISAASAHLSPSTKQGGFVDFVPQGGSRSRSSSLLAPQMGRLSVSSGHGGPSGGLPPPSPLLEAYKGTYQSISPMVAPMSLNPDSDMSDLEPLSKDIKLTDFRPGKEISSSSSKSKSGKSSSSKSKSKSAKDKDKERSRHKDKDREYSSDSDRPSKPARRVILYDAATEAAAINKALSHTHASNIDTDTITRILPELTHDQILTLRSEYKKIAKVNGKGINLAKHIKLKLTGNYGKAAHVTALGRWESEGYWANFFYQSHGSRRELLIESLMGRTNAEVRAIKDEFRDKRYGDDLRKMVERELRADKFRTAVGWVLEERRQEETDVYPPEVLGRDVQVLAQSLGRKEGGETAMLEIVVRRSDAHLREVLRVFERETGVNFAREALKRSGNLVGEVLAHILNGVINRPARDALLLRHAIKDIASHNRDEELRYELLISRLIRLHWDQTHLQKVKREYRAKTGKDLEKDIGEATRGDFKGFMIELCDPRG